MMLLWFQIQLTPAQMQALQLSVQGKQAGQPIVIQTTQASQVQPATEQTQQYAQVDTQVTIHVMIFWKNVLYLAFISGGRSLKS